MKLARYRNVNTQVTDLSLSVEGLDRNTFCDSELSKGFHDNERHVIVLRSARDKCVRARHDAVEYHLRRRWTG